VRLEPGQVAFVTGGASGIGRAMVNSFAARGLTVVLADVEQAALDTAVGELTESGATARGIPVDVRRPEDLDVAAEQVLGEFGRVDVLCNNAGVITARRPIWEHTADDWRWIVDVNLLGVAYGIRAFVPAMVAAGRGHVVNTASMAGLTTIPGGGNGAYSATKHAVVGLSETLRLELATAAPEVGVTVLCPGPVPSRIHEAARNRPGGPDLPAAPAPAGTDFGLVLHRVPAEDVGEQVATAIERRHDYVLTHADLLPLVRGRVQHLLDTAWAGAGEPDEALNENTAEHVRNAEGVG
jgi:NAD(P)-dependent dehydrogenase (short-subunit alcohol dehydrogenase family)